MRGMGRGLLHRLCNHLQARLSRQRWHTRRPGLVAQKADDLDDVITRMLETPGPVIADIRVAKEENCFPMIPSGAAHNDMLLGPEDQAEKPVSEEGMVLV